MSYKAIFAKEREAALHEYCNTKLQFYLHKFEVMLCGNAMQGQGKHFIGKHLTWADLCVFDILEENEQLDTLHAFQGLAKFKKYIQSRPRIAAYLNRVDRPKGF